MQDSCSWNGPTEPLGRTGAISRASLRRSSSSRLAHTIGSDTQSTQLSCSFWDPPSSSPQIGLWVVSGSPQFRAMQPCAYDTKKRLCSINSVTITENIIDGREKFSHDSEKISNYVFSPDLRLITRFPCENRLSTNLSTPNSHYTSLIITEFPLLSRKNSFDNYSWLIFPSQIIISIISSSV